MSIPSQVILNHVVESFIGLPVQENSESKPATDSCSDRYSVAFPHTDFVKPLKADYVVEIAQSLELIVAHAISLTDCDILIGEADRLLGSIIHEMSASTGIPYSLINWYPEGSPGEFVVQKNRGFSGTGVSYLNGMKPGMRAVVIGDTLDCTLNDILKSIQNAGASTIHVCYILDLVPNGVTKKLNATLISLDKGLESKGIPSLSILAGIDMDPTTKVTMLAPGYPIELKSSVCLPKPKPVPCVSDLKSLTEETRSDALRRIESGFVGIPIISNPDLNYPYCFLQLTDFVPIMTPDVVERMADMCVALSACLPDACDLLVSECDRGGGPLVQSLAKRLRTIPFVMAMWSTRALNDTTSVAAQIGFSGQGILRVNGVDAWRSAYAPRNKTAKPRIVFVDDMLSSGGTAEGVLKAVESAGGIPEEAIFISEKIYVDEPVPRKGFERLMKTWPKLKITSLIQFAVSGSKTRKVAKEEWVH